jgi:hypothetical protein
MQKGICFLLGLLVASQILYAQADSIGKVLANFQSGPYLDKVGGQAASLNDQMTAQSTKYLQGIAAEESKLQGKLAKTDPAAASSLFGNVQERYQKLQSALTQSAPGGMLKSTPGQYIPSLDSLKNTLLFLQNNKSQLNGLTGAAGQKLTSAVGNVEALQNKIQAVDNLKTVLDQRKQYLTEQLGKFGMTKDLGKMNEKVYYYKQQVSDWKASVKDPGKMQQKAVTVLSQLPAYKSFISKHSYLSSLFGQPEEYNLSDSSMKGLQTRAVVQKMVQDKLSAGGPGAGQQVAQQMQDGMAAVSQLKDKLLKGGGSADPEDPGFKPNGQKTKSLWKRLEYGANMQFEASNNLLPTIADLALSLGYKLNDNGTIGVGAAYKMGLGNGFQHIQLSGQGLGLRSYIDWKVKKNLYLSGGYELNYLSSFQSLDQLKLPSAWQKSGLIGLSRKYQVSGKVQGKLQLLFDFLSYSQVPKAQPIVFRVGWSF